MSGPPGPQQNPAVSGMVTVIPDDLKKLARHVVRGFYSREDVLIIDMLVRHHCLREDDLSSLLKFDKKMVRAQMAGLKRDKLIQEKQRMETRSDDPTKVEKMNCYFINYKIFVNIVKYKLDHMRKKMETSDRDASSRASFKCSNCLKNFTDLEVNDLFDPFTGEMHCTFCKSPVEEDEEAGPQGDSRKLLATFNEQMKALYDKLVLVENIKLDPSVLEPEPAEIGQKPGEKRVVKGPSEPGGKWSGEATRGSGLMLEEQDIKINFGGDANKKDSNAPKDVPIWITQSTVAGAEGLQHNPLMPYRQQDDIAMEGDEDSTVVNDDDEITRLLLQHEKKNSTTSDVTYSIRNQQADSDSDKSDDSDMDDVVAKGSAMAKKMNADDASGSDDDADDGIPTVTVNNEEIAVTDVNDEIISRMTADEKERYTQIFQDFYAHMYD